MNEQIVVNGPSDIKADDMDVSLFKRILDNGMIVRVFCNRMGTSDSFRHQIQYTEIYVAIRDREGIVYVIHYHIQRPLASACHAETFKVCAFFDKPPRGSEGHSLQDALDMMMSKAPFFRWVYAQQNLACVRLHEECNYEVPLSHPFVLMELDRLQKHVQDIVVLGWNDHHEELSGLNTAHFNDCISALLREHMGNLASTVGF